MTTSTWLASAKQRLSDAGIESAGLEAQLLAAHVLLVDRSWLLAHPERPFPELAGDAILARRLRAEPLAYILGWREFYRRRFNVNPSVLIPRQETETLVEVGLQRLRTIDSPSPRVLDLGAGSGCVGISVKLEHPKSMVTLSDISETAVQTAQQNAADLGAEVGCVVSDRFAQLEGDRFDLILTNPPYIGAGEQLPKEVGAFEPEIALYSGKSGFEFYEKLALEAGLPLTDGGALAMEVGYTQADEVRRLFESAGWHHLETVCDLGGVPRVVVCEARELEKVRTQLSREPPADGPQASRST